MGIGAFSGEEHDEIDNHIVRSAGRQDRDRRRWPGDDERYDRQEHGSQNPPPARRHPAAAEIICGVYLL